MQLSSFFSHYIATPRVRVSQCMIALASVTAVLGSQVQAQGLRASPAINHGAIALNATQLRSADFIVAIVNSEPITNQQVSNRLVQIEQQNSARGAALPPRQDLYQQILEQLIAERTQIQHAQDIGVRIEESAIENAIVGIARQNQMSLNQFAERLKAEGIDINSLRKNVREELLLQRVREREVEPRVRVTEAELDAFIREQGDTPTGQWELNLSQILIAVPESANEAQVKQLAAKAQRAFDRAKAGEDFTALARELSDSADRSNGGQLGLRTADRYPNLFVEAIQNTPVGGVAAPIRSGAGFHVLKVTEKRQQGLGNLTVLQTRARHILLRTGPQLSESVARERLLDLRKKIANGQDFATAARENSQDGSARDGGDLGWAVQGQFVPEFEEVMNALALGQVSEPIMTRFGVHLMQVIERRERKMDDKEQREAARAALRDKKLDEAFATWTQEVRSRAYVELRDPPLARQ